MKCPSLTTATGMICVSGRSDEGAFHRALLITNKLIEAGRYDWRLGKQITFNPYEIDCMQIDDLVEGEHYFIAGYAPFTEYETMLIKGNTMTTANELIEKAAAEVAELKRITAEKAAVEEAKLEAEKHARLKATIQKGHDALGLPNPFQYEYNGETYTIELCKPLWENPNTLVHNYYSVLVGKGTESFVYDDRALHVVYDDQKESLFNLKCYLDRALGDRSVLEDVHQAEESFDDDDDYDMDEEYELDHEFDDDDDDDDDDEEYSAVLTARYEFVEYKERTTEFLNSLIGRISGMHDLNYLSAHEALHIINDIHTFINVNSRVNEKDTIPF